MTRFELQTSGVGSDHSTKWATTNHYRCCLCKCRQNQFGLWSAILRSSLIYLVIVPIGKYFHKFLSSSLSTPMAFIEYRLAGSILRCKRGNYNVYPTLDRRAFKDWPLIFFTEYLNGTFAIKTNVVHNNVLLFAGIQCKICSRNHLPILSWKSGILCSFLTFRSAKALIMAAANLVIVRMFSPLKRHGALKYWNEMMACVWPIVIQIWILSQMTKSSIAR